METSAKFIQKKKLHRHLFPFFSHMLRFAFGNHCSNLIPAFGCLGRLSIDILEQNSRLPFSTHMLVLICFLMAQT